MGLKASPWLNVYYQSIHFSKQAAVEPNKLSCISGPSDTKLTSPSYSNPRMRRVCLFGFATSVRVAKLTPPTHLASSLREQSRHIYLPTAPSTRERAHTRSIMEESSAKAAVVQQLMAAKAECEKSFSDVAAETGLTNVYVAQLLRRQAQLKPDTAPKLRAALPALTDDLVELMMQPPFRSYHPDIVHEPAIYRLNEAVMHFGESIKEIMNEDFGDGIMSAIDFYCSVDKVKGADGKDRVVVTFDGKYLPYTEQKSEHMMSRLNLK